MVTPHPVPVVFMHYLEDDLELLQTIPDELKRKCYEMRELEIRAEKVQSEVKEESRLLFDSLTVFDAIEKERRYRKIKEAYRDVKELREERLDICNYVHIMLEKYQKRLERDLTEFKMELDADLPGTTETIERELWESILERRRELLQQQHQDEAGEIMPPPASTSRTNGQRNDSARRFPPTKEEGTLWDDREAPPVKVGIGVAYAWPPPCFTVQKKMPTKVSNADNYPGTSSSMHTDVVPLNAAVFGPSTQAMMPSSPFSYPVGPTSSMNLSSTQSTSAGREAAPMSPSMSSVVMPVFSGSQESQYGRPVKLTSRVQQMFKEQSTGQHGAQNFRASGRTAVAGGGAIAGQPVQPSKIGIRMDDVYTTDVGVVGEEEPDDEEEDQNVYCICQQPSHGAMVACDNQNCQHGEWFHYPCVGISRPPEGKWYCPECSKFMSQPQHPC